MTIRFARIYFVRGGAPSFWKHKYEITDPPTSGFGKAVIIPGEKRSTILCPFTLDAFQVSNHSGEMESAVDVAVSNERLAEIITKSWETSVQLGFQRDFGVAALVLTELGHDVPKFMPIVGQAEQQENQKHRGGKAIDLEAIKPCRRASKRGEVAAFFMQGGNAPQSLHEAMARLGLTRSGVLSHLFTLNKDHGIGYELMNDCAKLLIPDGFDLFAYVEPEKLQRPEKPKNEDGSTPEPKKRTSGKAIIIEALKPIPDPSKRAIVAKLFINGFFPISEAMAILDLDRSAVLSHLFTINKDNGLGYELSEDSHKARLLVPQGHTIFGPKLQRAKKAG